MILMKTSIISEGWVALFSVEIWLLKFQHFVLFDSSVLVFRLTTSRSFAKGGCDSQFPWSLRRRQSRKCFFPEHSELRGSFAAPPDCPPRAR
jgi:hypothetical protein